MTKRGLAAFVFKIMGVYLFIQIIPTLPITVRSTLSVITRSNFIAGLSLVLLTSSSITIWILIAFFLVRFSDSLATRLFKEDEVIGKIEGAKLDDVMKLIFVCIGLSFFLSSLPKIIQGVTTIIVMMNIPIEQQMHPLNASGLISLVVQIAASLFLMLRPKKVVSLIKKYQS